MLPAGGGLLLVDKPQGCTSHDVVGQLRRVLRTRRIGHAGTLDPMATGLLVLAVDRSTKLLGHLALSTKSYSATIRLGQTTDSDDADGEIVGAADASGLSESGVAEAISALTGDLMQVPSSVSAIKVNGRRAYDLARDGVAVELAARPVTVSRFDVRSPLRRDGELVDLDVEVDCTTGTYIRALARDLGAALGVGGHLTALRRTAVGEFSVADAIDVFGPGGLALRGEPKAEVTQEQADSVAAHIIPVAQAVRRSFPVRLATAAEADGLRFGRPLSATGEPGVHGILDSTGTDFLGLVVDAGAQAKPILVWQAAG